MPGKRFHASERLHRSLERFVGHYVLESADFAAVEITYKGVGDFGYPFVPMLVHQVVDHASCGLWQIGIYVGSVARLVYVADYHYFFLVGRKQKSANAAFDIRGLQSVTAVGQHGPHLHGAFFIGVHECYP